MNTLRRRAAAWSPATWAIVLWVAFALVHTLTIFSGWHLPSQPMGDVYNVYEPWSAGALRGAVVGVTEPWVYPPFAIVPMVATRMLDFVGDYTVQWGIGIILWNALGFAILLGRGASLARRWAAGFWLAYILLLGPVGMYRIDAATVPIAVVALLWIMRRPAVASALLAIGAWIKIWPGALLLAAFSALRSRVALVWPAAVVSAIICASAIAAGGAGHLFGFLTEQSDRGLQIEAPISLLYVWGAMLRIPGTGIFYNRQIITFQVYGPGAEWLAAATTPLLAIVAVTVALLGWVRTRAGVSPRRVLPPLALALTLTFIVTNKVGSPQFQDWLIAPLVMWIMWDRRGARRYALAALSVAGLTQLVYPILYAQVLQAVPIAVLILTARNVILVALLVAAIGQVMRLEPAGVQAAVPDERAISDAAPPERSAEATQPTPPVHPSPQGVLE